MDSNLSNNERFNKEAIDAGLAIIGLGRNNSERLYRIEDCQHEKYISLASVRHKTFQCKICVYERLKEEAIKKNLKLLGSGTTSQNRKYIFLECGHEQIIGISHVKSGKFICRVCNNKELRVSAIANDLEYISKGGPSKSIYRFKECGHLKEIKHSLVEKGTFICQICKDKQFHDEADKAELELVKHYSGKAKIYRFKKCGHSQKIDTSNVRNGIFECQSCLLEKIKSEADTQGLIYLQHIRFGRKLYRFKSCGHEQVISPSDVRNGKFICRECQDDSLKREAKEVGLIFLGKAEPWKGLYQFIKCGHKKKINYKQVRANSFLCQVCEDTYRTQPSYVYLLHIRASDYEWVKLGYAKNIDLRIKGYSLPKDAKVELVTKLKFKTAIEAEIFEQKLHKTFSKNRLSKSKMKKYHEDGFNECYPINMKSVLISKLS